jgi:glycyl-tRNA synthetase beta chain
VAVHVAGLAEDAELRLHRILAELGDSVREAIEERRYAQSLRALIDLRGPVDEFFSSIMVMDDNIERRNNRLALLRDAQALLGGVADLSRLPG